MNNKLYLFIVLALVVLFHVPGMFVWNKYITNNDAAIYVDTAINLAEGKGFVSPINRHINDPEELREYVGKYGNTHQSIRIAPLFIYSVSLIYRLVGFNDLHLAIHIFNILLFIILLTLMFYHLRRSYPRDLKIAWLSVICVGFNPAMFTYGAHMENLMLLLFYVSYLLHFRVIRDEKPKLWLVIFYALSLALCFLSKYSAFPFILAFFIHLLIIKKYRLMLISGILATVLVFPWFILREWLSEGFVVGFGQSNPFAPGNGSAEAVARLMNRAFRFGIASKNVISNLFSWDGLALLSPFLIIPFVSFWKESKVKYALILLIVLIVFFGWIGDGNLRYVVPFLVVAIPLSIEHLSKAIKNFKARQVRAILVLIFGIQFSLYLFNEIMFVNNITKISAERKSVITNSMAVLDKYNVDNDDTVFTNILGLHLFTDANLILSPAKGMTEDSQIPLLEAYETEYVIYKSGEYGAYDDIFTDYTLLNDPETRVGIKLYLVADEAD